MSYRPAQPESSFTTSVIAFLSFITFGISTTLISVAWPAAIQLELHRNLADLGILLFASTAGSLAVSINAGRLITRWGVSALLIFAMLAIGAGMLLIAIAPSWELIIIISLLLGTGSGALDSSLNTYAATSRSPRFMNWLHANFGVGAALGPLIMTQIIKMGASWRIGYLIGGVMAIVLMVAYLVTRRQWRIASDPDAPDKPVQRAPIRETLRLPVVWLGIALFFLFAGLEVSTDKWAYSLFAQARFVPLDVAGNWISLYWAGLTAGRIVFGALSSRLSIATLLRLSMGLVVIGTLLIWQNTSSDLNLIGLILVGFAIGPAFPLSMTVTPRRVSRRHAPDAIGFQIGAATIGLAMLPSLTGVLAENIHLEIIGPVLCAQAVMMFVLNEFMFRVSRPLPRTDAVVVTTDTPAA